MKTFQLMYQLGSYYCKTDFGEARVISFLGERTKGWRDIYFGFHLWKHADTKNVGSKLKIRNLEVSCRSQYASPNNRDVAIGGN